MAVALLCSVPLLLAGCATPASMPEEPVALPAGFSVSGTEAMPDRWWEVFGVAELSSLVEVSLADNFNLEAAWMRLLEAEALARRESAPLLPTVDGFADGEISRGSGRNDENIGLGLVAGYEVDLWGRIDALADVERFLADAQLADYQAAAITISAEVTRTWFGIAEAAAQSRLLAEQVRSNAEILELIEARVATGELRSVDLLRQAELLEATREEEIIAAARRKVLVNRLSVLIGQAPFNGAIEAADLAEAVLVELPPLPDTGLPADLVRRRPDIERARQLILSADSSLSAALSDRYPRLDLLAAVSTSGSSATDLFRDWAGSFAAGLIQPVFDGGERAAEIDRTRALRNRRLAEYGQTVLVSFQEVEDALVREDEQRRRLLSLRKQERLASESVDRLRMEYLNGVGNYLDVLAGLTVEQRLRRELISTRLLLIEARITLYRSLAGGFETPREGKADS